ncbi:MAG: NB-ARC domain-containing protein [Actinomycetota bacterium]|nr:NB-ARC domain-containing protein [Actinomycetota bacterium]
MEYRILGPVEALDGDRVVALGGAKQRGLLATLLLDAGHVVSVERLIDVVWGMAPPKKAVTRVHGLVSQLRRSLVAPRGAPARLITRPPGYLLEVAPEEFDLAVFDRLVTAARSHLSAGLMAEAAERLGQALALWRGPPLGGVDAVELVEVEAPRLVERRLGALEDRITAELALGRHAQLVAEVEALVAVHPLRERLRGQLMLALYRAGRQADALAVYRVGRQRLADELGLDPGTELQRLEHAVLTADPSLELSLAPPAVSASVAAVPRQVQEFVPAQLPPDIADFTGRDMQVTQVSDLLVRDPAAQPLAVPVAVITGRAGVGKTALAVHIAHQLRERFPDGQLYVNLRGAEAKPLEPAVVLARFLRALGVDGAAIPDGGDERSELYRSRLAERSILVVLDNAASQAQIRSLLPGSPTCGVLITRRARLPGLEGTCPIVLDILDAEQAVELLVRLVGVQRVAAEPLAAEEIVRLCGYLPLAVRVAGAKLAARPHWTLARLAERLADERHLLDELVVGDLEVRTSLALSYHGLDEHARRALRLLGLLDAPDFASWVVAALLNVPVRQAEERVDALLEAQLLDVCGEDDTGQLRYRLHDLIRAYARERALAEEQKPEQRAALQRLLSAWLTLADEAAARIPSSVPRPEHGRTPRWPFDPDFVDALVSSPTAWFDAEQASLIVVVTRASALDMHEGAWDLAAMLMFGPLAASQRFDEWRRMAEAALAATHRAGNRRGEAVLLCGLGLLHYNQDRFSEAERCYRQALTIFTVTGNAHGEALARFGLGTARQRQARCGEALVSSLGQHRDRLSHRYDNVEDDDTAAYPSGGAVAVTGTTAAITA